MTSHAATATLAPHGAGDPGLLRVLQAAQSFLSYRQRVTAIFSGEVAPPADLGAAIERDFLFYDFERSAQALREAVAAAEAGLAGRPAPAAEH